MYFLYRNSCEQTMFTCSAACDLGLTVCLGPLPRPICRNRRSHKAYMDVVLKSVTVHYKTKDDESVSGDSLTVFCSYHTFTFSKIRTDKNVPPFPFFCHLRVSFFFFFFFFSNRFYRNHCIYCHSLYPLKGTLDIYFWSYVLL